jgi:hypothetical protein
MYGIINLLVLFASMHSGYCYPIIRVGGVVRDDDSSASLFVSSPLWVLFKQDGLRGPKPSLIKIIQLPVYGE